jgi:nucleoside-diphosphate-sugar epimerase
MNKMQQHNVALVAGASGIVGRQLVNTLLHHQWEVIGLSRREVTHPDGIPMVNVDLLDAQDTAGAARPERCHPHLLQRLGERGELDGHG